jgi:Ca2+-transporting ATPase
MSVIRHHNGQIRLFSKGAPEVLIPLCTSYIDHGTKFTQEKREHALKTAEHLASQGFRVLALADKVHHDTPEASRHQAETDLTFVGLVALIDPLRATVKDTVTGLHQAGITPLMITGDHPAIARYIAMEAGIIKDDDAHAVLTGTQLDELFPQIALPQIKKQLLAARVFARVAPQHKVMIVELYQQEGYRIAMTGDGINDAAAIKRADVGIAMSNGMDVTRDIADVVVTGAYDALIRAVSIGRTVKLRTQLYIQYLLSGNATEVGVFLLAVLFGLPHPLTPPMLLMINLLTDAAPAMAMAVEPEDPDVTKIKVTKQTEGILSKVIYRGILIQGIVGSGIIFALFLFFLPSGLKTAQTVAFTLFIFMEAFRGFTARSFTKSVFTYGFFTNPLMNGAIPLAIIAWAITTYVFPTVFDTTPLPPLTVATLFFVSLIPAAVEEVTKVFNRKK